ncbi:MAG: hypothetical protein IT173_09940 [Acidobacteria bacterium]|nr:hypothetical protein [Acidobacteriota bacterium]
MDRFESPLDNIRIASPCSANWNEMQGNERRRFCGECKLNVYNLSGMTRYDAENLLRVSEGKLCVRYFQRSDGTVLTADCPVGWAKVKQRLSVCAAAAFSLLLAVLGALAAIPLLGRDVISVRRVVLPLVPRTERPVLMGNIAAPTPKPTTDSNRDRSKPLMGKPAIPAGRFAE